jgi:hypothetical protein
MAEAQRIIDPCTVPGSEFTPACTGATAFAPAPTSTQTADDSRAAEGFVLLAILAALYFIPYFVARKRAVAH